MKKSSFCLFVIALLICIVGCAQKGATDTDPDYTPTLSISYVRINYPVGATEADLDGALIYTDKKGKTNNIKLTDEGVSTDFSADKAEENKIMTITYEGLKCSTEYHVLEPDPVNIDGTFIVDKNTTLTFSVDDNTVIKKTWRCWYDCKEKKQPLSETCFTYSPTISRGGRTCIYVDGNIYYPDENRGLVSFPNSKPYFSDGGFVPKSSHYYVSEFKENNRSNPSARNKYLVMKFDVAGNAFMWFTNDYYESTLNDLSEEEAIKIDSDLFVFSSNGVFLERTTINNENARDLELLLRGEGYASNSRAFRMISRSDQPDYYGYSYTMRLSDVKTE